MLGMATVPLVQLMESVIAMAQGDTKNSLAPEQMLAKAGDAIKLISTAFCQLTEKRREMIRPSLPEDLSKVCTMSNPATDQLLGTDL